MARRALIGHTGFVGSNLDRQDHFTERYNSRNFREMSRRSYDDVVCAGVSAVKWWANKNADSDWQAIAALRDVLATVEARAFTLLSTVDVYSDPREVDEATEVPPASQPYGRHRRLLEMFVQERFREHLIVRLPGLFGVGLKKNLIFDVLENRDLSGFDRESTFQFYHLDRLTADIAIARAAGLTVINLATEPMTVAEVIKATIGVDWTVRTKNTPVAYDMRTRHAALWARNGCYIGSKSETLQAIAAFAASWCAGHGGALAAR